MRALCASIIYSLSDFKKKQNREEEEKSLKHYQKISIKNNNNDAFTSISTLFL
jgi:hypothetical protein